MKVSSAWQRHDPVSCRIPDRNRHFSCRGRCRDYEFQFGKAYRLADGKDGAFLCSGITVKYALEAAKRLSDETGASIKVFDMQSIKPIDVNAVIEAGKTSRVIVAQDHNVIGGLGDAVAFVLAKHGIKTDFEVKGTPDEFFVMGHAPWLYHKFGMDAEGLYDAMKSMLEK